ncbi:MAG: protein kinase [Pseudolabrys sp.]|nr:protein kinase [Pseudolabrys sp.]
MRSFEPGTLVDGFRIEGVMHHGGMATLFDVTQVSDNTRLVMKVPHLAEGDDPAEIVSFEMEAMIMPRLTGPYVPRFVAAGDFEGQPYIVMERIEGESLLQRLKDLPLPYDEVAAIGCRIGEALHDLHRQHVLHLDIKPSNVIMKPDGGAVLLDFGLSHHEKLPDLMQEEFRVPFGTGPYMSPEQLLGVRTDPRSDIFSLGVLLYFFSTGVRPFGESEMLANMRRRLWRDPKPPRLLRADYPPWLQEVVLRCLEINPAWRYPTTTQVCFDLANPGHVALTARSEKLKRDRWSTVLRRRFNPELPRPRMSAIAADLSLAPIVLVAVDISEGAADINETLRLTTAKILATVPSARLACLNILKQSRISIDQTLDDEGRNKHLDRLIALRQWASSLKLDPAQLTVHVIEASDPAPAILEFVRSNKVDQVIMGARQGTVMRKILGSVSAKVAAEAPCTVTVVRPPRFSSRDNGPAA